MPRNFHSESVKLWLHVICDQAARANTLSLPKALGTGLFSLNPQI